MDLEDEPLQLFTHSNRDNARPKWRFVTSFGYEGTRRCTTGAPSTSHIRKLTFPF